MSNIRTETAAWRQVPPEVLLGEGLEPYDPEMLVGLFDWAENPQGSSRHLMPHSGRLLVDVVEFERNAVHQPNKPGDEIVGVLNGTLILTTDAGGEVLEVPAGRFVLIPEGWAGLYRAVPGQGDFRELAIVPHDYFERGRKAEKSGGTPRLLDCAATSSREVLHRGRYLVETQYLARGAALDRTEAEEVIVVLDGAIHPEASARLGPGQVLILPEGSGAEPKVEAGTRLLRARWLGR
jgi:quercetin dioxygenase-like cupin family protein